MSLPTPIVLLHKLGELDVKCFRKILRVEGQEATKPSYASMDFAVAQLGLSDAVVELLSNGIGNGNTALHVAFLKYGPGYIFDSLLKIYLGETTRNFTNADGLSLLHMACTRPYLHIVRAILESDRVKINCKVSQRSKSIFSGYTPLHFAVQYGQYEVADVLLKYNANVYAQDRSYSTPLHIALEQRNVPMIDLLLAHDRERENVVNIWGLSHLMVACAGNDAIAAREYIQAAPQVNIDDFINGVVNDEHPFAGYSPLKFAMEYGRSNTAQMLKNHGAVMASRITSRRRSGNRDGPVLGEPCRHGKVCTCFECLVAVFNIFAFAMFLLLLLPTLIL